MKYTYLQIVQKILSAIDSDEIDSIDQTVESEQVAEAVEQIYYNMLAGQDWPHLERIVSLSAGTGLTSFSIPEDISKIHWIRYAQPSSVLTDYSYINQTNVDEFLTKTNTRGANTTQITIGDIKFYVRNNAHPKYWTTIDDNIVLDSFDITVEPRLSAQKLQVMCTMIPEVEREDLFIFDLPTEAMMLFLNECMSYAFTIIKQEPNVKIEKMAQTQRRRLSWDKWVKQDGIQYPDYGRRGRK